MSAVGSWYYTPEGQAIVEQRLAQLRAMNPQPVAPEGSKRSQPPVAPTPAAPADDYWGQFQAEPAERSLPGAPGPYGQPIAPAGGSSAPTAPGGGYETGTFTGGGQYPLSSVWTTGLNQPWTTPFNRPVLDESTDPGYAARMAMGTQAIERSNAARGTLRTGGNIKDLLEYAQNYGSNEYDKIYNRALGEYEMAHGIYNQNQNNIFNRLQNVANMGQQSAGQMGSSLSDLYTSQGNANASGTVGANNAWQEAYGPMTDMAGVIADYYNKKRQAKGAGGGSLPAPLWTGDATASGARA